MVLVYFLQRNMTLVFLKNFKSEFPIMKDKFLNKETKNFSISFLQPMFGEISAVYLNLV